MTVDKIFIEWIEKYPNTKNLEPIIQYYEQSYADKEVLSYIIEENSIKIEFAGEVDKLNISFKI